MDSNKKRSEQSVLPDTTAIEQELARVKYRNRFLSSLRGTIYVLIVVAAAAILVATLWLPVLRIYGESMVPTLQPGDLVVSVKGSSFETGDIIAFYYNNKILVKRVIAQAGDWVDIDEEGNVYINGEYLDEPYIETKAYGETNITFPYQVPDGRVFVIGDHRSTSVDSRNTSVGPVAEEQIVGKISLRVWPLGSLGTVGRKG